MPARLLFDISGLDLNRVVISKDEIREANPQRFEFEQIDYVCHFDPSPESKLIVGIRDLKPDEFWVRGHMPGRPIFPGVLMVEAAAQLCGVYCSRVVEIEGIYGFGGADNVRFRRMLTPGDRLTIVGKADNVTPRRSRFTVQGLTGGEPVFDATIMGISLPSSRV